MHACNSCRNCYERVRRKNLRREGRDKVVARFASQLRHATDANRVLLLCRQMFARYGGLAGFSKAWAQQAQRAMQSRPGSTPALNLFSAVANLTKHAKDARPPVKELDDENLEQELAVYVTRLIQDRPELAVKAAMRLSWQVSPTEQSPAA